MNSFFSAIQQAAAYGYTSEQILRFLGGQFKKLKKPIEEAKNLGHDSDKILSFLSKTPKFSGGNEFENTQRGLGFTQRGERVQSGADVAKKAIPAMGVAVAAPFILPALSRALPVAAQQMLGIGGQGSGAQGAIPQNIPAPQPPPAAAAPIAQAAQAMAPGQGAAILKQMGGTVQNIIESLKGKEDPETIAAVLDQKILSPGQKKWLSEQTKEPLSSIVSDYLSQDQPESQQTKIPESQEIPPVKQSEQPTTELVDIGRQSVEPEQKSLDVGSEAQLPSGDIGIVKSIKNGIAKIEINGKERHVKAEDLDEAPLPAKDLADLFQDLLAGIEKETGSEVSRMATFVGYDPEANELNFLGHQGASYTFDEIDPEDIKLLTSFLSKRKTTGENYIGAWKEGSRSPIGAAMSALLQKYRKRAEGGKPHKRKYETIYSALEPAHKALKEKKKATNEARKEKYKKTKKPRQKNPGSIGSNG